MPLLTAAVIPVLAIVLTTGPGPVANPPAEGGLPGFDSSRPESWTTSLDKMEAQLRQTTKALIAVALDGKRPAEERRKAILALGRIDNQASLEFLAAHVALRILMEWRTYDDDRLKETPCYYVLLSNYCKPTIISAILSALDQPRTDAELSDYVRILKPRTDRGKMLTFVEFELTKGPRAVRRKNLEALQRILKESE